MGEAFSRIMVMRAFIERKKNHPFRDQTEKYPLSGKDKNQEQKMCGQDYKFSFTNNEKLYQDKDNNQQGSRYQLIPRALASGSLLISTPKGWPTDKTRKSSKEKTNTGEVKALEWNSKEFTRMKRINYKRDADYQYLWIMKLLFKLKMVISHIHGCTPKIKYKLYNSPGLAEYDPEDVNMMGYFDENCNAKKALRMFLRDTIYVFKLVTSEMPIVIVDEKEIE